MDKLKELQKAVEIAKSHFENVTGDEVDPTAYELKAAEIRLNNFYKEIKEGGNKNGSAKTGTLRLHGMLWIK